jgi:hypothetical protein
MCTPSLPAPRATTPGSVNPNRALPKDCSVISLIRNWHQVIAPSLAKRGYDISELVLEKIKITFKYAPIHPSITPFEFAEDLFEADKLTYSRSETETLRFFDYHDLAIRISSFDPESLAQITSQRIAAIIAQLKEKGSHAFFKVTIQWFLTKPIPPVYKDKDSRLEFTEKFSIGLVGSLDNLSFEKKFLGLREVGLDGSNPS